MKKRIYRYQSLLVKWKEDLWWSFPLVHWGWRRVSCEEFKQRLIKHNPPNTYDKWKKDFESDAEPYPIYLIKDRHSGDARHLCIIKIKSRRGLWFMSDEESQHFEQTLEKIENEI
jgi:hypothetical protein